jgi:hypothetical protein
MTDPTLHDFLDRVYALIEHGWTQGYMERMVFGRRCYCLLGAVYEADGSGMPGMWGLACRALCGRTRQPLDLWNDAPRRTKAEVLQLIRDTQAAL